MSKREPRPLPGWAKRERVGDLAWIAENIESFWSMAKLGYQDAGRGLVFVNTTITLPHSGGIGHPMAYLEQAIVKQLGDKDSQRMVKEYHPDTQFVTTLLKSRDRVSSYRLGIAPREAVREQLSSRIKPDLTTKEPASVPLRPPNLETLKAWQAQGGCEAACLHHCWVEADGTCTHGNPSWLLALGLI